MDFHYDKISEAVVRRLTDYLRCIRVASKNGKAMLTSQDISRTCGLKPSIIRKDLALFGAYGVKGMGYNTHELINHLNKILGINHIKDVVLIGAGHLGTAIMRYPGFATANFNFIAAFDNDPAKIGTRINQTKIFDIKDMHDFIEKNKIEIVILAVPGDVASGIVDELNPTLVKGVLNFSSLVLPPQKNTMHVHNIDLAKELEVISFCMKNCLTKDVESLKDNHNNQ